MGQRLSVLRAASKLLLVGTALPGVHLGCNDSDPQGGSATSSGGSAGADSNALGAATSSGANGGTVGTDSGGGSGGSGGSSPSTGGGDNQGAGDSSTSGVGSNAGAAGAPPFEGDPRCAEQTRGSVCVGHFITTCDDVDDDGWVDFEQTNCAPGVCAGEDPSCEPANAGESCADPIVVSATGFVLRGDDFAADFEGDIDFSDHDSCYFGDDGSSDAVFEVSLEAGQTLSVVQTGKLPAVLALQASCGGDKACRDSDDSNAGLALEHTASEAETLFVILDAFQVTPEVADYALHIDIDPTCGNGIFEGAERCDDGNRQAGDGCSAICEVEFPYECTQSSPSQCQEPPSLGIFGPDEVFGHEHDTRFAEGERHALTFTLTERVLLDIRATSNTGNTGDINFRLYSAWDKRLSGIQAGNEIHEGYAFEAGKHFIELWPAADLPSGYTLTLTSHGLVCGDGEVAWGVEECDNRNNAGCETCTVTFGWECDAESPSGCSPLDSVGAYSAGDQITDVEGDAAVAGSEHYLIEFVADVVLTGSAVSPIDASRWRFETVKLWSETQQEFSAYVYPTQGAFGPWALAAGVYVLELVSYTGMPEGYTLHLETVP